MINFFLYLAAYFCAYSFWCVYWPCRWILDDYKRKRAINYQLLKRRNTSEVCVFFDVSLSPIIARPTRGRLELCGNYFLHEKSLWTTFEKIKVPAQENEHIIKKRLQKFLKLSILPDSPLLRDENYSFSSHIKILQVWKIVSLFACQTVEKSRVCNSRSSESLIKKRQAAAEFSEKETPNARAHHSSASVGRASLTVCKNDEVKITNFSCSMAQNFDSKWMWNGEWMNITASSRRVERNPPKKNAHELHQLTIHSACNKLICSLSSRLIIPSTLKLFSAAHTHERYKWIYALQHIINIVWAEPVD